MDRLLTVREAASMLSCSQAAIRKWMYQRRLPRVKVGRLTRVSMRDLNAFVSQDTKAGHTPVSRRRVDPVKAGGPPW